MQSAPSPVCLHYTLFLSNSSPCKTFADILQQPNVRGNRLSVCKMQTPGSSGLEELRCLTHEICAVYKGTQAEETLILPHWHQIPYSSLKVAKP